MTVSAGTTNGPLYAQLVTSFREDIESGEWSPGHKLPSERELCELFGVSRITVRRALDEAAKSGLVDRVHGVGNFVASTKMRQSLPDLKSFGISVAEEGLTASTRITLERSEMSDFAISRILDVSVGSPTTFLQLLGLGGEMPLVFYESYLHSDLGGRVVAEAQRLASDGIPFSTLDIHRAAKADPVTRIEQTFEAVTADQAVATFLEVEPGWPIFRVESVLRSATRVLEYRVARYRGDKYKFAIDRSVT